MASEPVATVLAQLKGVKAMGGGWVARCPAHADRDPSLKIDTGSDGRALLRCHAGCEPKAIVAAMGLTLRDLMPADESPYAPPRLSIVGNTARKIEPKTETDNRPPKHTWPEIARYDYTDADGVLLFSVVRRELDGAKTFTQVQPDGTLGLKGITSRPLYRWPQVLDATAMGRVVLVVEGEKDVASAESLGYTATTNCGGANSWKDEHAAALAGANVVVVPDNDGPGREWALGVCASLLGTALQVRVVALPGVPVKGDLTDWVEAGGTADALDGMILRAKPYQAGDPIPDAQPSRFTVYRAVDLANLPPLRWLVNDVLPVDALGALVGPSGIGKTFVTLDLACAVATGTSWLGHATGPAAPVLYIAAEGTAGLRARLVAWTTQHGVRMEDLNVRFICETVNLMESSDPMHVVRAMTSFPVPPQLVVIDTLHRAMPGGDENSAKDVGMVVAAADKIRRTAGCTVLLVHHTKKDTDVERGSTALRGACDALLMLKDEDGTLSLECEKQKDAAGFAPHALRLVPAYGSLVVEPAGGTMSGDRVADPANLTTKQLHVLKSLADSSTALGLAATAWKICAGVPERTFYRAVKALVDAGLVLESDRAGRYSVSMTGHSALAVTANSTAKALPFHCQTPENGGSNLAKKTGGENGGERTPKGVLEHPHFSGPHQPGRTQPMAATGSAGALPSRRRSVRTVGPDGPPSHVLEGPRDETPDPWWQR